MTDEEMFGIMRVLTGGKPWVLLTVEGVANGKLGVGLSAGGGMDTEDTERVLSLGLDAYRKARDVGHE
jgi:hypothetical protein